MKPARQRRDYVDNATARKNILDAAAELFTKRGFDATSVRELGEHAGIGQSSLYYHAKNKSQILLDINHEFMTGLVAAMDGIAAGSGTGFEKLERVIRELLHQIAANRDVVTVVLHERRSLPEAAAKAIQKQRDHVDEVIDGILREGIDDGTIRPASVELTRLAVTGMTSWASTWFDATGSPSADEIADHFVDILRNGLAGPGISATP